MGGRGSSRSITSGPAIRGILGCDERAHGARPSPRRGLGRKNGGHFRRRAGNAGWSCWRRLRLLYTRLCSLPSVKATINLEYYRFNYQLSNEINFSGLISVLDAEVGLLRK